MERKCYAYLYLAFALISAISMAKISQLMELRALVVRGEVTQGTILRLDCNNHQAVAYSVQIGNMEYFGEGTISACSSRAVGEHIDVTFDPENPDVMTAGNPSHSLRESIRGTILAALVIPLVLVLLLRRTVESAASHRLEKT